MRGEFFLASRETFPASQNTLAHTPACPYSVFVACTYMQAGRRFTHMPLSQPINDKKPCTADSYFYFLFCVPPVSLMKTITP